MSTTPLPPRRRTLVRAAALAALAALAAAALAAACKGGADHGAGPGAPAAGTPLDARPAPPRQDAVAQLAAAPHPTRIGPLARLALGPTLTAADARAQAPALFATADRDPAWTILVDEAWPGVAFRVRRLVEVGARADAATPIDLARVALPAAGLRARLTAAWGPPRADGDAACWTDATARLRACLHDGAGDGAAALDLSAYAPLAELLAYRDGRFGFEGDHALLGARAADLRARFGARLAADEQTVWLPPAETGGALELRFVCDCDDGRAPDPLRGLTLLLPAAQLDDARAQLERALGHPTENDDGVLIFRRRPRIALYGAMLELGDVEP